MRTIKRTARFKRDYKREKRGIFSTIETLDDEFKSVLRDLTNDMPLPQKYRDHRLAGQWKDCRDCHIRDDLVLIYRKRGNDSLELVRLGSHSALGL